MDARFHGHDKNGRQELSEAEPLQKKIQGYTRPSWDEYFLEMAQLVSRRATCLRRKVGAVLVKDKKILATGYNGAPSGIRHCIDAGCLREKLKVPSGERHELCYGLHAEQNVLLQAALHGISTKDSVLYITNQPCVICAKMLINAGVKEVIASGDYPDKLARDFLKEAGIQVRKMVTVQRSEVNQGVIPAP
ncbi:MAG: cytidine/deoxycytidylate deaminase family protein, partial [Candidatus Omnitrophota bacterium]|nr:cytidine/deoxycytidylate deaminase family protein [Candidatus Omnitrophota bacterium]